MVCAICIILRTSSGMCGAHSFTYMLQNKDKNTKLHTPNQPSPTRSTAICAANDLEALLAQWYRMSQLNHICCLVFSKIMRSFVCVCVLCVCACLFTIMLMFYHSSATVIQLWYQVTMHGHNHSTVCLCYNCVRIISYNKNKDLFKCVKSVSYVNQRWNTAAVGLRMHLRHSFVSNIVL